MSQVEKNILNLPLQHRKQWISWNTLTFKPYRNIKICEKKFSMGNLHLAVHSALYWIALYCIVYHRIVLYCKSFEFKDIRYSGSYKFFLYYFFFYRGQPRSIISHVFFISIRPSYVRLLTGTIPINNTSGKKFSLWSMERG